LNLIVIVNDIVIVFIVHATLNCCVI